MKSQIWHSLMITLKIQFQITGICILLHLSQRGDLCLYVFILNASNWYLTLAFGFKGSEDVKQESTFPVSELFHSIQTMVKLWTPKEIWVLFIVCGSETSKDGILISHLAIKKKKRKKNILCLNLIWLFRKVTNFRQQRKNALKMKRGLRRK